MKTKLTVNIDSDVIKKAKRVSARKKRSLSSLIEEYLVNISNNLLLQSETIKKETITDRIRKFTRPLNISDEELKKNKAEYLEAKYGK